MGLHHLEAFWTKAKGNSCCCGSRTKEVVSAGCRWVRPASWRRNGESSHKPLSEARSDSQRLEVGAQRLRSVLSSVNDLVQVLSFPQMKGHVFTWRPNMAMLSYKAKCQHYFLVHFLDIQGSTKAQHSPLLISEQSRSSAGVSGTKICGYSLGCWITGCITGCSLSKACCMLFVRANGTLEERVSWLQSTGPRAWIHHFHPGIAPQRTGKFSCFGNVGLERISCHWQAALFLHHKWNWNRVPNFTPISYLTSSKLP